MAKLFWSFTLAMVLLVGCLGEKEAVRVVGDLVPEDNTIFHPEGVPDMNEMPVLPNLSLESVDPPPGKKEEKHEVVTESSMPTESKAHREEELKKTEEEVNKLEKEIEVGGKMEEDIISLEELEESVSDTVDEIDQIEQNLLELDILIEELNELTKLDQQLQQLENLLNQSNTTK
ncbi:hypothetical protein [Pseudoneobacillus sp. C159]